MMVKPPNSTTREIRRAALVGCGRIATVHLQAVREHAGADVVAVCDLDGSVAAAFAAKHGVEGVYTDVREMMEQSRPEVVHLLTPPRSHRALVEAVAPYGAHLYVEKPFASDPEDAEAMVDTATREGVQLCPGHSRLFDPQFVELQRRVRDGEIGRVVSVRAEQGFAYEAEARAATIPWSYTYDWGIFDNLVPHPLSMVTTFLEAPGEPQVVGFNLGLIREAGVEEIRVLIPSRAAVGEIVFSTTTSPMNNRLDVVGTKGRITADWGTPGVVLTRKSPLPNAVIRITANWSTSVQLAGGSLRFILGVLTGRVRSYMGLRALIGAFYRALEAGAPPPVSMEDGVLNVVLMAKVRDACRDVIKEREGEQAAVAPPAIEPVTLVTGAAGFLGGRLVERLTADGVAVRATTRLASRARPLDGVQWVSCNLASEDDLAAALTGIDTVYHCAAMSGGPGSLEDFEEANVHGTLRLARLAADAGVRTLVYVSSISVYAKPRRGRRYLDESAPYDTRAGERGVYTQSKLAADRALLEYARDNPCPRIVMLRPGAIYGPGAVLPVGRFTLPSPSSRRPFVAGGAGVPMPLAHIDNVVDAMRLGAANDELPPVSVFNIVDAPDWTQGDVAHTLATVSGGRLRPVLLPYPLVWSLMLGADTLTRARSGVMGTARYRLERTLADMRFRCDAARDELGWTPRVTLAEGLAQVLDSEHELPFPH